MLRRHLGSGKLIYNITKKAIITNLTYRELLKGSGLIISALETV
jgi:hypothetical protein